MGMRFPFAAKSPNSNRDGVNGKEVISYTPFEDRKAWPHPGASARRWNPAPGKNNSDILYGKPRNVALLQKAVYHDRSQRTSGPVAANFRSSHLSATVGYVIGSNNASDLSPRF